MIFSNHGYRNAIGSEVESCNFNVFLVHEVVILSLYSAIFNPLIWIFVIPILLLTENKAHDWVWAAIPKPARRRLRRIWADAARARNREERVGDYLQKGTKRISDL